MLTLGACSTHTVDTVLSPRPLEVVACVVHRIVLDTELMRHLCPRGPAPYKELVQWGAVWLVVL